MDCQHVCKELMLLLNHESRHGQRRLRCVSLQLLIALLAFNNWAAELLPLSVHVGVSSLRECLFDTSSITQ